MPALLVFTPITHASAPTPIDTGLHMPVVVEEVKKELTVYEKVDFWANEYNVSAKEMHATIKCESGYSETAHNKSDPMGGAKGIGQFLTPTFSAYSKKAGIEGADIWNTDHQLQTMAYMFSVGEKHQWTCWRKLYL
jgi:hypothetical protein